MAAGDVFVLATDGVYERVAPEFVLSSKAANTGDLDKAAEAIAKEALRRGSEDNLTVQVVRASSRSHIYLVEAIATGSVAIMKTPSIDLIERDPVLFWKGLSAVLMVVVVVLLYLQMGHP